MVGENNDLPATWITSTVGEVFNIVGGGTPQTDVDEYWDGEIPWISSADIYGPRDIRPRRKITPRAIEESAANLVPANSIIVVTRVGLGKVALAEEPISFSQDSQALIGQSELHLDYVLHYLSKATQRFKQVSRGTTIVGVTKKQLAELTLPIPPVAEQKRIVDEIETQFARLDTAVADLRRLQHNLDRYRASVLKVAFEGRLVPQDTADEPAEQLLQRILAERRRRWEEQEWQKYVERARKKVAQARRKAAGRPTRLGDLEPEEWQAVPEEEYRTYLPKGEKWKTKHDNQGPIDLTGLPKLPPNWSWARVDQLADVRLGRQRSPQHHSGPNMRPYLRAANATWNGVDLIDINEMNFEPDVFENYRLADGDILLAEASGSASEVGKPFIWHEEIEDCAFQNTLIRVRLDALSPEYFKWHFSLLSAN
jgi:type I restriction enzyme, S subunit